MHVRVLAAIVFCVAELPVEGLDARAVAIHPEPVGDFQGCCQQFRASWDAGGCRGAGSEQDVCLAVELLAGTRGIATHHREPAAVFGVASWTMEIEIDAMPGDVLGAGTSQQSGYREAVQHPCTQPQLGTHLGQGAACGI